MTTMMTARLRMYLLVMGIATLACADSAWYESFTIGPKQQGMLKTTFSYNSTNRPDILTVPISLVVEGYKYVFNQTNDISDTFYWKRQNKNQYKYDKIIDASMGGRVKMSVNLLRQRVQINMQGVNLLVLNVTNKTGYHPVSVQIGAVESSEVPYFVNYHRRGFQPYASDFFLVRTTKFKYNSATADRFILTGICKYNAAGTLPDTINAIITVSGQGAISSFADLIFTVPLARTGPQSYAFNDGIRVMSLNFQSGVMSFRTIGQPLPVLASYQTNFNFRVNLDLNAGGFSQATTYRARTVGANVITY
ncbi:MAG: hypothetical protein NTV22_02570 [bacterium]|nr:hypothetical protein [bacterium]